MLEHKTFPFEIAAADLETGVFDGYASVFGVIDDYDDVIEPGAFAKTLQERGDQVKVCWMHQWDNPIGVPLAMEEHSREQMPAGLLARNPSATGGLFVRAKISDTAQGRDALVLLNDGVVDRLSIGYDVIKADYGDGVEGREEGVRYLREVRLWEFSPVTWAANEAAWITGVKRLELPDDVMEDLREFTARPGATERLAAFLRNQRAAEPSQIAALTARARVLRMQLSTVISEEA